MPWEVAPVPLGITYVDPDGGKWDLSDQSMSKGYVCSAITGIEGMPVMMQTVPLLDGTAIPIVYIPQTGTIGIGILVGRPASGDQVDYYNLLDSVVRAFYNRRNDNAAPAYLQIMRPDGSVRQIAVYTTSGLNTPEVGWNDLTLFSFSLSTPDPYWTDVNPTSFSFTTVTNNQGIVFQPGPNPPYTYFGITFPPTSPGPGVALGGPHTVGGDHVFNWGESFAYPTWLITGPGTVTCTNNTSGRSWGLNFMLNPGQTVQVITQLGKQTVMDVTNPSSPVNLWSHLVFSGPHDLWPLLAGDNWVTVSLPGMTTQSQVQLTYINRWPRA